VPRDGAEWHRPSRLWGSPRLSRLNLILCVLLGGELMRATGGGIVWAGGPMGGTADDRIKFRVTQASACRAVAPTTLCGKSLPKGSERFLLIW
jgi:hypothetical protein